MEKGMVLITEEFSLPVNISISLSLHTHTYFKEKPETTV